MLFLNAKFPKTKKNYNKLADDNTGKLKTLMSKLIIQEQQPASSLKSAVPQGGQVAWSYSERKKKPKTFKL